MKQKIKPEYVIIFIICIALFSVLSLLYYKYKSNENIPKCIYNIEYEYIGGQKKSETIKCNCNSINLLYSKYYGYYLSYNIGNRSYIIERVVDYKILK